MAKYSLSFTTQGNDLNTYYLAASVLGMVATKNSSSSVYINSSYGFNNATYAKNFQTLIDGVFDAKYWKTAVKCFPAAKMFAMANVSNNATKTATAVTYATSTGGMTGSNSLSGLNSWLNGLTGYNQWSNVVNQSVPYVNYKISCLSETDYKDLVNAVIKAGGLTTYEQTNSQVQS